MLAVKKLTRYSRRIKTMRQESEAVFISILTCQLSSFFVQNFVAVVDVPGEKPYKIFQDLQRSFRIFKDLQKLGFFKVLWRILHRSSKILNNFQRSCSFKILQRSSEGSFKIHKNLTKILIESHFLLSRKILKRSLQGSSKIYNDFMRILLRSLVRYSKDLCMDPWRSF